MDISETTFIEVFHGFHNAIPEWFYVASTKPEEINGEVNYKIMYSYINKWSLQVPQYARVELYEIDHQFRSQPVIHSTRKLELLNSSSMNNDHCSYEMAGNDIFFDHFNWVDI